MKKLFIIFLTAIITLMFIGCTEIDSENVLSRHEITSVDDVEEFIENGTPIITTAYYEMKDGSFETDSYEYKYRLEVSGTLNNAESSITYIILSNIENISFEQAWKASGLSSNMEDYFDPKDACVVGFAIF